MSPSVTAIVVARGGSVRLPGKALLPFAGTTLIGHKLRTLRACKLVDRICVNTDCPRIAAEAFANDAEVLDGKDYDNDTREMIRDSVSQVEGDLILWAHPTNPLVQSQTYDDAITAYLKASGEHDSLCSVTKIQRHCWFEGEPLNFHPWSPKHELAGQLTPCFFQDGAIFIMPRKAMEEHEYFYGVRPLLWEIPAAEGLDVDTQADFDLCTRLYYSPGPRSAA